MIIGEEIFSVFFSLYSMIHRIYIYKRSRVKLLMCVVEVDVEGSMLT